MTMKRSQFFKFKRQFNLRLNYIINNKEHPYCDLVERCASHLTEKVDTYFSVIFNLLLRGYLQQTISFIITKTGSGSRSALPASMGRATALESLGQLGSQDSVLDHMEFLIKKKDPVFMAVNTVKVKKAFFGATVGSQAKYRLENIRYLTKIEQSITKMEYCRQITDIITKFIDKTGQDIQGLDELKLDLPDGKLKVPSLRSLAKNMGEAMNREELEAMTAMKKIKSMNLVSDIMKQRRRFNINLRGDFVNFLIVELAKLHENIESSPRYSMDNSIHNF